MGNKRREGVEEEKKKVEEGGQVKNEAVVFAGDRRQLRNVNNNKTNNKKKKKIQPNSSSSQTRRRIVHYPMDYVCSTQRKNPCLDVVCMFYARGPVRMDVSYRESRVARDPANRPEMRVRNSR